MPTTTTSHTTAPTQLVQMKNETYAYRRFGSGRGRPLLCLQHFTGTLDNWDPAVTVHSRRAEKSFCSTTPVSVGQLARSPPP